MRRPPSETDRHRLSAIGIVLESMAIQKPEDEEIRVHTRDVAKMAGIPEAAVRRLGSDHFTWITVPGKVVGYDRAEFYVADDEAAHRRRYPERYVLPPEDRG